jgi:exopolyphosphatase/guanosine-5'-triphosphate,3'-diphosphate pyrophosphatase
MLRCAFDVGSGSTKCMVGLVNDSGGLVNVLFSNQQELLLSQDLGRSSDNRRDIVLKLIFLLSFNCVVRLSERIILRLIEILKEYKEVAIRLGVQPTLIRGVATQVFRSASNGAAVLDVIFQELEIRILLVSQVLYRLYICPCVNLSICLSVSLLSVWILPYSCKYVCMSVACVVLCSMSVCMHA